jgi:hypothetical protein
MKEVSMAQKSSTSRKRSGTKSRRRASTAERTGMQQMRSGKHKAKSRKQAVAISLAKGRQKGAPIAKRGTRKKSR